MRGIKSGKLIREYRLLAGGHIQADPMWKPSAEEIKDAQDRGTSPRAPIQSFTAPAIVKSDKDLVALFPEKFQYVTDPRQPVRANANASPASEAPAKVIGATTEDSATGGISLEDLQERSKETAEKTPHKSEEESEDTPEVKPHDSKHAAEGKSTTKHKHK